MNSSIARTAFLLISVVWFWPAPVIAQAEYRWVSDQFEVTMRRGKGTNQAIVRVLPTGTRVELIEVDADADYSFVRTGGGTEGWVLNRFLMREPTARELLVTARAQLADARSRIDALSATVTDISDERDELSRRLADAEGSNDQVQQELERVRDVSSSALEIDEQNRRLKQRLIETDRRSLDLEAQVERLGSRATREWFVVGAGVLLFGLLLGLVVPRIRWKKKSSWGDL